MFLLMVHLNVYRVDRQAMARQLFAAAKRLEISQTAVKSTSEGFWVPRAIAADLFPSDYPKG